MDGWSFDRTSIVRSRGSTRGIVECERRVPIVDGVRRRRARTRTRFGARHRSPSVRSRRSRRADSVSGSRGASVRVAHRDCSPKAQAGVAERRQAPIWIRNRPESTQSAVSGDSRAEEPTPLINDDTLYEIGRSGWDRYSAPFAVETNPAGAGRYRGCSGGRGDRTPKGVLGEFRRAAGRPRRPCRRGRSRRRRRR